MRIDRLLCHLRFVRTRSAACKLVDAGHIRRNGERVTRCSRDVQPGDILTLPLDQAVRLVEITALPTRRGAPRDAQACYRELDPQGQTAIAAPDTPVPAHITRGMPHP
ncbi:RNA-binding S4 domain-containing protein [Qipengyuania marisflavi]|uniref:RNA-binding S4 domain-containing protein n=1 Tax=Qipengyuania marisflavi TaxID=2486356 RepID=A0A5S3P562_9SPHN|nr:S4 domain-containing protein [Qipengyuania marisflavi]TMM48179.1 RNA-binding S4 domain-containing protein [Qipengyuania marisflavi]